MESSRDSRRRHGHELAVEFLEGRALLAAIPTTGVAPVVQPSGARSASVQPWAPKPRTRPQSGHASPGDVLHVGKQYTRTVFSRTTGTVISDYTKALLKGNGKQLKNLGHSPAVKQLGADFQKVADSSEARSIGHSLSSFGHSISRQFHKLFG